MKRLRMVRRLQNMSQTVLAKKSGSSRALISMIETDALRPGPKLASVLAKVLDMPICELFPELADELEGGKKEK